MNYAGTPAAIGMAEEQYIALLPQMDDLVNIYDFAADWEKIEMPCGMYMAGSRLNQQHKDERKRYHRKKPEHIHAKCPDLLRRKREFPKRNTRTRRRNGIIRTKTIRP